MNMSTPLQTAAGEISSSNLKVIIAPFDDSSTDVILRSGDGVDFYIHKIILALSSPVFQSMFTLPQPPSQSAHTSTTPVIEMAEHSTILAPLLRACYPARYNARLEPETNIGSADTDACLPISTGKLSHDLIRQVLETARKYDIAAFDDPATMLLLDLIPKDPIGVYATAARYSLKAVAAAAAKQTLKFKHMELDPSESMNFMTAVQLYDLLRYHRACGKAAHDAITYGFDTWLEDLPDNEELNFTIVRDKCCECYEPRQKYDETADWFALPSVWEFLNNAAEAVKNHPDPLVVISHKEVVMFPRAEPKISEKCQWCTANEPMYDTERLYTVLMKLVTEAVETVRHNSVLFVLPTSDVLRLRC